MIKNTSCLFASVDLNAFLPCDLVTINPLSPSLHYSHAIFEGLSMIKVDGKLNLFHPWLNLERMRHNADTVGISMDTFPDNKIIANMFALAVINGFHKSIANLPVMKKAGKSIYRFYVRPLLHVESDSVGLGAKMEPRFLMIIKQMGDYLKYDEEKGIDTLLFPHPRTLALPSIKTASNYQIGILSRRKMEKFNLTNNERCAETLFLNQKGNLIEGSGENIVLLRGKELISPKPSEGAIPGITLRMLSSISKKLGLKFRFGSFALKDLKKSDCLFLTGNAAGIIPVSSVAEVDKKYNMKKWHYFESGSNRSFQKLKHEYELMETAQGGYAKYHTQLDEWINDDEKTLLYSYGRRFLQRMVKAHRSKPFLQSKNMPSLPWSENAPAEPNTLLEDYGLNKFYPDDSCFNLW